MGAKSKFCNALDHKKQGGNTSFYPRTERAHTALLWASQTGNEVPPKAAPHTVFKYSLFELFFPALLLHAGPSIPEIPADLLHSHRVQWCQAGCNGQCARSHAAEYRNHWRASSCEPSSYVTSDFSVFVLRFLTDGSVIGWHGSFPRGNEKCRHLSSNRFLCVCKYFCFNIYRYYSKIGRSCQGKNSGLHTLRV